MPPRDPYREWSYADRCDAWHNSERDDRETRRAVDQWDRDSESSERAYRSWQSGRDFSDPDPDGRFH